MFPLNVLCDRRVSLLVCSDIPHNPDPARILLRKLFKRRRPGTGGVARARIDDCRRVLGGDISNEGET
jgi:hypothetical protein